MKRTVVTGMGVISSIGNSLKEVTESLKLLSSGIQLNKVNKEMGLRSHVSGNIKNLVLKELIDRKFYRFMGDAAAYGYLSAQQAIQDSDLNSEDVSNYRTGLIMGSGGASSEDQIDSADILRNKSIKKIGPYRVTRAMGSTVSACLSTFLGIKGINYSISSACATSAHCIGHAAELIKSGQQDIVIAGGSDDEHWTSSALFDAMGALSSKYNNIPEAASRAYDVDRDGFVIAGGGGTLVLEDYEYAKARGAKIYAELTGYGATSDGYDMVQPSGEGAVRCMKQALKTVRGNIDYINTHGTSTPVGDLKELEAIKEIFNNQIPYISSTKSLTGHSLGATGVHEAIYSLLMMDNNFLAGSANINHLDDNAKDCNIITETINKDNITNIMSNSFGFGGTNATLVFSKI